MEVPAKSLPLHGRTREPRVLPLDALNYISSWSSLLHRNQLSAKCNQVAKSPHLIISNSNRVARFATDSPTSLGSFQSIISQLLQAQDTLALTTLTRSIPSTSFTTLASPPTSNGATTQTSVAASTPQTDGERDPSLGLKLGIELCVTIGAIVIFTLLLFVYRRRRRSRTNLTFSKAALPIAELETTVAANKAEPAADEREDEVPCLSAEKAKNECSRRHMSCRRR
jgi:hypothetical protein